MLGDMTDKVAILTYLPFVGLAAAVGGVYAFFVQSYGVGILLCGISVIIAVVERRAKMTKKEAVLAIFPPIGFLAAIGGLYAFWIQSYGLGILLIAIAVVIAVAEWRAKL